MKPDRDELLDRLRDSTELWVNNAPGVESGALIETAFLMAAADGAIGPEERGQLVAVVSSVTARELTPGQARAMVDQLLEALRTDGWTARIDAVAQTLRDPSARRTAYRLAAGVAFVDGVVPDAETRLFGMLADAFAIPSDEAAAIMREVQAQLSRP